jgi:hypothetical protein
VWLHKRNLYEKIPGSCIKALKENASFDYKEVYCFINNNPCRHSYRTVFYPGKQQEETRGIFCQPDFSGGIAETRSKAFIASACCAGKK